MRKYKLVFTDRCPNCPVVKEFMKTQDIEGEFLNASNKDVLNYVKSIGIDKVPTVIFFDEDVEIGRATTINECKKFLDYVKN